MSGLTFSGDVVVYLLGLAATWGAVMWRIAALEKKVDKHNNLVERLYVPSAQVAGYQAAANWSTILGYANNNILPVEGSPYE